MQSLDIKSLFVNKDPSIISRHIRRLVAKHILRPIGDKKRKYTLLFENNYLLRGIMHSLDVNGFLTDKKMAGNYKK